MFLIIHNLIKRGKKRKEEESNVERQKLTKIMRVLKRIGIGETKASKTLDV